MPVYNWCIIMIVATLCTLLTLKQESPALNHLKLIITLMQNVSTYIAAIYVAHMFQDKYGWR